MFAVALTGADVVELVKQVPALVAALVALVAALRAGRAAKAAHNRADEAAREQITFALEKAVRSGALSAPESSPLRSDLSDLEIKS